MCCSPQAGSGGQVAAAARPRGAGGAPGRPCGCEPTHDGLRIPRAETLTQLLPQGLLLTAPFTPPTTQEEKLRQFKRMESPKSRVSGSRSLPSYWDKVFPTVHSALATDPQASPTHTSALVHAACCDHC